MSATGSTEPRSSLVLFTEKVISLWWPLSQLFFVVTSLICACGLRRSESSGARGVHRGRCGASQATLYLFRICCARGLPGRPPLSARRQCGGGEACRRSTTVFPHNLEQDHDLVVVHGFRQSCSWSLVAVGPLCPGLSVDFAPAVLAA